MSTVLLKHCNYSIFNKILYKKSQLYPISAEQLSNDTSCFIPGECQNSSFLQEAITLGENSCLHYCQRMPECRWFTYHPENSLCVAMSDCVSLDESKNAVSGQTQCPDLDNQCWVKGICKGTLLLEVSWWEYTTILAMVKMVSGKNSFVHLVYISQHNFIKTLAFMLSRWPNLLYMLAVYFPNWPCVGLNHSHCTNGQFCVLIVFFFLAWKLLIFSFHVVNCPMVQAQPNLILSYWYLK